MKIEEANIDSKKRLVELKWSDGCIFYYPFTWLRDNCQCRHCFHPESKMRIFQIIELDPSSQPRIIQVQIGEQEELTVTWPDGHQGSYGADWLYKRGFTEDQPVQSRGILDRKPAKPWGAELKDTLPVFQFPQIFENDGICLQWLICLEELSFCLLKGAPAEAGQVERLARLISWPTPIFYGEKSFHTVYRPTACSPALTKGILGLHCDQSCQQNMPEMQFLHCIAQTPRPGGDNFLVDGLHVANLMKKEHPEMYKLLTTVPVCFADIGTDAFDYCVTSKSPVLKLNLDGDIESIHWSGHARESRQNHLPLSVISPLYDAFCKFEQLCMHPDNCITLKMEPGDILCFNNTRLLHGRTAFALEEGDHRHLEGSYVSLDDFRSKRRVLEAKLQGVNFKEL